MNKGYFPQLSRNGMPLKRKAETSSTSDLGYKDQNSTFHLLEAFTDLYRVWPDKLLRQRIEELLSLATDKIIDPKGYIHFYFQPDWTPISFKDSSEAIALKHKNLDHVSFGHDVETAYLMLEAADAIGRKNDKKILALGKKMVNHALQNGWDNEFGGFYEEGVYLKNKNEITVTRNSKNWWGQTEGLNTLLIMADYFPKDSMQYFEKFKKLWQYSKTYMIDHEYGDWYEQGLDKNPERKTALKGHVWKETYHQLRCLSNCVKNLKRINN